MKVLVTGDRGYLGSVLVPMLRRAGHDVVGIDAGWREAPARRPASAAYEQRDTDVRDLGPGDLAGVGAVVHLAGVVGTPEDAWQAAALQAQLVDGARAVAAAAAAAGVERTVMASGWDVYRGRTSTSTTGAVLLDRSSPPASARIAAEEAFRSGGPAAGCAVLRLATLYGASPRLRIDDEVNRAVVEALVDGEVTVDHDGRTARAYLHVKDASRTILHVLARLGHGAVPETTDVGRVEDDLALRDALELVGAITGARVRLGRQHDPATRLGGDPGRLEQAWPGLSLRWTLAHGIRDLCRELTAAGIDAAWVREAEELRAQQREAVGALSAGRAPLRPVARVAGRRGAVLG